MVDEISVHGCSHYRRKCSLMAPCCKKMYSCRLCHDEEQISHTMNRKLVTQIKCLQCDTLQDVQRNCSECGILFANYSCMICRLFDDQDKQQFHCDGCGICRVGGRDNFVHCEKCDMCIGSQIKETHKCLEKASKRNCPVCLEDLHTSRLSLHVPDCGHLIHRTCLMQMLKEGLTSCPQCNQSIVDMSDYWGRLDQEISMTLMPEAYRNYHVNILCRDCHKESNVVFHIIGLKCTHCGAYNTTRIGGDDPLPENSETGPVVDELAALVSTLPTDSDEESDSWETIESDVEVRGADIQSNENDSNPCDNEREDEGLSNDTSLNEDQSEQNDITSPD